jgi:hypothetical protein
MNEQPDLVDVEGALRAYAEMMNTLDCKKLEPLLAPDFHYASQWVFSEIETKQGYLDYIRPKLETIKWSGNRVWAEMAHLDRDFPEPCVVLAQGNKDNLIALVLAKVADGLITRFDMCAVPSPYSAKQRSSD